MAPTHWQARVIDRELLRLRCETELAPLLRALEDDPRDEASFRALVSDVAGVVIPGARFGEEGATIGARVHASGIFGERAERYEIRAGVFGATRPAGLVFAEIRAYAVQEWQDRSRPGMPYGRKGAVDINRRRETDVFRGLFIGFDLGAALRGTTFVDPHRVGPAIASRDALEPAATGDAAFERAFRVTSSDPDEARALLLPSTRAGLLRLRDVVKQDVHVSISDGRVSVAIELGPDLFEPRQDVDFERVAAIADLFGLADLAAAALPVGVALPTAGAAPGPGRPATSRTRLTRAANGLTIAYTTAASRGRLAVSAVTAPVLAWCWLLAVRALLGSSGGDAGVLAAMIPLAVGTLLWLYAAQDWWGPVTRVEIDGGELRVRRGLLRWTRVPTASIRTVDADEGTLRADDVAVSPKLRGDELRWLRHEVGQAVGRP
jgi:hypothetical protein